MKAILSILFLVTSTATCPAAEPGSATRRSPRDNGTLNLYKIDPGARALLDELGDVCWNAGGTFDGADCDCGDQVLSAQTGACVERDEWFFNEGCAEKIGTALDSCLRLGLWTRGATRLSIVRQGSAQQIGDVEDWLNDDARSLLPRIPPTPEDGSGATIVVTVGDPPRFSGDQIKIAFDNQIYHPQTGAMVPQKGYVELHVRSLADLPVALGARVGLAGAWQRASTPSPDWRLSGLLDDLSEAAAAATDAKKVDAAPFHAASSTGGSCLDSCVVERMLLTFRKTGRRAVLVDRYVQGIRQNRELKLLSPINRVTEAKIVFDFGDRPSLVYIPMVVRQKKKLLTRVYVFDGTLQPLGTSDFTLLDNASLLDDAANAAKTFDDLRKGALAVISFETGYSFRIPSSFEWILRGPHGSQNPALRSSLLGWYAADTVGTLEYARGFIPSYQDSPFADRVAGDHPYNVARILRGVGGPELIGAKTTYIVPLGSAISSPMTAVAVNTAKNDYGVRVGSLSVAFSMSPEACSENTQPLLDTGILLAVAAGNDSADVARTNMCPQRLSPSPNLLVVGASSGDRMESYSNYGPTSVDIAADGRAPDLSAGGGTSFAAPRVAFAAAQLAGADDIGVATNAQVRMALLLSADLPAAGELPVRCGGSLASNLQNARVALTNLVSRFVETARMSDRVPFSVALGVAEKMPMPDDRYRRVAILIRNDAVCKDQYFWDSCAPGDTKCQSLQTLAQNAPACDF